MKNRPIYTAKIEPFIDKPIVKVITGIRRSGKSGLLQLLQQHLKDRGVMENQIVYLNYESLRWSSYRTYDTLYAYVDGIRPKDARCYLFIDEIQEVAEWERAVNSMMVDWDVDIYITGSNSRLLSSELATYLAGRYVEFLVHPLSYKEFLNFHGYENLEGGGRIDRFDQYMRQGGFPMFHLYDYDDEEIYRAVRDIYASVLLRDTVQRYSIRNIEMLERLVHFLFDNIGNTFSASSIIRYLKSQGRSLDSETLYNYLQALESSFVINKVKRYDIKGKELLKTNEKYYVSDLSLIYSVRGYTPELIAGMLENLVYLELRRNGYEVYTGWMGSAEVDFVARKGDEVVYLQVTNNMESDGTRERELRPLMTIKDNHPKYIVVGNPMVAGNIDGVRCVYIGDFLLEMENNTLN